MPATKPFPSRVPLDVQRQLLFQPESNPTKHVPLEHAHDYPFDPATPTSRVNAWWLAESSWLSYWRDAAAVTQVLRDRAGLSCEKVDSSGAECYVGACPGFAIVMFRGTRSGDWNDIFDDALYAPIPWEAGHVHKGFARRLDLFKAGLEDAFGRLEPGCRVWFTGHSLGGALATLAAYRYRSIAGGVCTFGSPLVGNELFTASFANELGGRSLRYANNRDLVTRVPPAPFAFPFGLFSHVDDLRWISKDGAIETSAPALNDLIREVFGRTNAVLDLIKLQEEGGLVRLPVALTDHTPLYYATRCWNDFATHWQP